MKKLTFTTQLGDHVSLHRNGLCIYSCHETAGHKIDLFVPDYEGEYKFDYAENQLGRSRMSSKLPEAAVIPEPPKAA